MQSTQSQMISQTPVESPTKEDTSTKATLELLKSDDETDIEKATIEDISSASIHKKKKVKRLVLSDDESDDNHEEAEETSDIENEAIENSDEEEAKEVMYDSEENEIEAPQKFQGFRSKKG